MDYNLNIDLRTPISQKDKGGPNSNNLIKSYYDP